MYKRDTRVSPEQSGQAAIINKYDY